MIRIVSNATNANNSRVTIFYTESGVLTEACNIAESYKCGFSHNVCYNPNPDTPTNFGTISFNKGNHEKALTEFLSWVRSYVTN